MAKLVLAPDHPLLEPFPYGRQYGVPYGEYDERDGEGGMQHNCDVVRDCRCVPS